MRAGKERNRPGREESAGPATNLPLGSPEPPVRGRRQGARRRSPLRRSVGLVLVVAISGAVVGSVLGQAVPVGFLHVSYDVGRLAVSVATLSFDLQLRISVAGAIGLALGLVWALRQ